MVREEGQLDFIAPRLESIITALPDTVPGDIRDWRAALASRCNWGWLHRAKTFGATISPSDIDFIVERHGQFLVGETKTSRDDIEKAKGQEILLRALARFPAFTVFYVVGGVTDDHEIMPREIKVLARPNAALPETWNPIDRQGFQRFCGQWFARAHGR